METPHINIVYYFEQHVEVISCESEKMKPLLECYDRTGIILLAAGIDQGRWIRELAEYEIAPQDLEAARRHERVERDGLQEMSSRLQEGRAIPFGLDLPCVIDSDRFNRDVALPGDERIALRQDLLYLPTVFPVVPEMRPESGDEWNGQIAVMAGAGRFTLDYAARLVRRIGDDPVIQVTLQQKPKSVTIDEVALTLTPEGSCTVRIVREDGSPMSMEGQFRIRVRARIDRDGKPVDVEVLDCRQEFTVTRVPAAFTDDALLPVSWKLPVENQEGSP